MTKKEITDLVRKEINHLLESGELAIEVDDAQVEQLVQGKTAELRAEIAQLKETLALLVKGARIESAEVVPAEDDTQKDRLARLREGSARLKVRMKEEKAA